MVFTTKKKCAIMLVILNGAVGIFALTARKKRREIYDQRGNMLGKKMLAFFKAVASIEKMHLFE